MPLGRAALADPGTAEDRHRGAHQREGERLPELLLENLADPLSHLVSGAERQPQAGLSLCLPGEDNAVEPRRIPAGGQGTG